MASLFETYTLLELCTLLLVGSPVSMNQHETAASLEAPSSSTNPSMVTKP
jgi:hypothetical protein